MRRSRGKKMRKREKRKRGKAGSICNNSPVPSFRERRRRFSAGESFGWGKMGFQTGKAGGDANSTLAVCTTA